MHLRRHSNNLLSSINARFIEDVGPVGDILIEEALELWLSKRWHGPAAFRHYVTNLATNIDSKAAKERFLHDAGQLLLEAQRHSRSG